MSHFNAGHRALSCLHALGLLCNFEPAWGWFVCLRVWAMYRRPGKHCDKISTLLTWVSDMWWFYMILIPIRFVSVLDVAGPVCFFGPCKILLHMALELLTDSWSLPGCIRFKHARPWLCTMQRSPPARAASSGGLHLGRSRRVTSHQFLNQSTNGWRKSYEIIGIATCKIRSEKCGLRVHFDRICFERVWKAPELWQTFIRNAMWLRVLLFHGTWIMPELC